MLQPRSVVEAQTFVRLAALACKERHPEREATPVAQPLGCFVKHLVVLATELSLSGFRILSALIDAWKQHDLRNLLRDSSQLGVRSP